MDFFAIKRQGFQSTHRLRTPGPIGFTLTADGKAENGIHDVLVFDYKTPIHVIVSYEDGNSYVLRPMLVSAIAKLFPAIDIPWQWLPLPVPGLKVTRTLDSDGHMV